MKKMKRVIVGLIAMINCFSVVGCSSPVQSTTDGTKSQIKVTVWQGGYRKNWADNWATKFEQAYEGKSLEEGKTGVEVEVLYSSANTGVINVGTRDEDIIFSEQSKYFENIKAGELFDITEWVTTPLTEYGETRSIAQKMSKENQVYYGQSETNPQYFALPWYMAFSAINYDIDLFNERALYFTPDGEIGAKLSEARSNGPDGLPNTSDDGLPATFDEFFELCDYLAGISITPVIWSGKNQQYMNGMFNSIVADIEGYDNMNMNYQLTGNATDLIDMSRIDEGVFYKEATSIGLQNGHLTRTQKGYYYAYDFLNRLINTKNTQGGAKYLASACSDKNVSHTGAQQAYLTSCLEGKRIAMLIDSTWWYNEANDIFAAMEGQSLGKNDRRFGVMPIPKIDENHLGPQTTVSAWPTTVYVNKKIGSSRENLIRTFFRFIHSDESLVSYTKDSSAIRPFTVEMPEGIQLPNYTWEQLDLQNNNRIVMPYSTNNIMKNYSYALNISEVFSTIISGKTYTTVSDIAFDNVSTKNFMKGFYNYYSTNWSGWYQEV